MKPRTLLYLLVGLMAGYFLLPYNIATFDIPEWPDCETTAENKRVQITSITYMVDFEFKCDNFFSFMFDIGGDYPRSLSVSYLWCGCWDESNILRIEDYRAFDWENYTREDLEKIRTLIYWRW